MQERRGKGSQDEVHALDQAGYKEDVEKRQSREKERAVRRQTYIERRSVEINVRGTKRKAFRKETPDEKAASDRATKKQLLDRDGVRF